MVREFEPYGVLMIIYDWISMIAKSRHEIGIIYMLFSPNKNCHITPPPPHNDHLSTTATFSGPQSGCYGEV